MLRCELDEEIEIARRVARREQQPWERVIPGFARKEPGRGGGRLFLLLIWAIFPFQVEAHDSSNNDALSSSSDLLDLLLQEDSRSGTGSAASGSMVSGSNGESTSASGTSKSWNRVAWEDPGEPLTLCRQPGSILELEVLLSDFHQQLLACWVPFFFLPGTGENISCIQTASFPLSAASSKSSNTSKYFGSVDSSENDLRAKQRSEAEDNEHFIKYVLQDPIWLLMANTDDKVMMTYQLPAR